jgi:outer membrane protein assembly factor BamD (BamD/ComL family)
VLTGAAANAREIEKLYQAGADSYAKGEYGKAADSFRKILTLDPQNTQAKKALERIIRLSR